MTSRESTTGAQCPIKKKDASKCPKHPHNEVVYVCFNKRCNGEPVCKDCVKRIHQGHKVVILRDVVERKKATFRISIDKMQQNKKQLLQEMQVVDSKLTKIKSKSMSIISEIQDNGVKMTDSMNEAVKYMSQACTELSQENIDTLKEYKNDLEIKKEEMDERLQKMIDIVENKSNISVYNISVDIGIEDFTHENRPVTKDIVYVPSPVPSMDDVRKNLCSLYTDDIHLEQTNSSNVSLVPVSEFEIEGVSVIYATSDGHCIVLKDEQEPSLWLVTNKGKLKKKTSISKVKPRAITLSQDDIIWLLCEDKSVRIISSMESVIKLFDIDSKNLLYDLCVTLEHNVFVASDKDIILYNKQGERLFTNDLAESGKLMIKSFGGMGVCPKNGLLFVLDDDEIQDGGNGRPNIVAFNKNLTFRFRLLEFGKVETFQPSLFTFDGDGNLLIPERSTHNIILVNPNGCYMKTILDMKPTWYPLQTDLRNNTLWLTLEKSTKRLLRKSKPNIMTVQCFQYGV